MTGLELLKGMQSGTISPPSIAVTMPMEIIDVQYGKISMKTYADERHLNPLGGVHGGYIATVLDSVTGCAIHSTLDKGVGFATIDLNIKMIKAVNKNIDLIAVGEVVKVSKSLGFSKAEIRDEQGVIYAYATATCKILRPRN